MPRPSSPRPSRMLAMLPVVVALLQTLLLLPSHAQNPNFVWCPHTSNYTTTSQFKRNLDRLLANLSTLPTPDSPGHFHSFSTDGPDAAYGFVQCRGDVLPADCATCLRRAASVPAVVSHCPLGRVAAIRYEDCLLRYSDEPLLGVLNHGYFLMVWNTQNITDRIPFNQRLTELVTEITTAAAAGSSRFAVGVKNFSEFRNIYGLVECTMDLSTRSCEQCLRDLTNHLPRGQVAGSTLSASCFLKYDTSPFFALSIVPPPPPPPLQPVLGPPPTSSTMVSLPADGSGSNSRGKGPH
ncbi:hypothetical protein Taro_029767 [Colocasia esculenta]|uniref:Gnk2-homologous domain-containing protein n=1 Tax=Colocasia esculenta TaxID=4460 RepID=A0A843VVV8_COLES|nr:hypothetical protein [Colocasia esculenta]